MTDAVSSIDATLLYRTLPEVCSERFLAFLNAVRRPDQSPFKPDAGGYANDTLRVTVEESATPLPSPCLTSALAASLTRIKSHDYSADVAGHRAYLAISVAFAEKGRAASKAGLIEKIITCQRAALAARRQTQPDLLYWAQSDMLFTAEELDATAPMDFPVTLVTRPTLYSGGRDPLGRERFGLRAHGAELFLGKPLVFAVTARPIEEMLALADFLILQHVAGVVPMTHGDVYYLSSRDELRITHVPPTPAMAGGAIRVTMARRLANRPTRPAMPPLRPAAARQPLGFGLPRAG